MWRRPSARWRRSKQEGGTSLAVEQAKLDVKKIEDKIAAASISAPFDGEVLALNIRPGNSVEAFKTVIVVGDPSALELTADLEASDVAELSVDMRRDHADAQSARTKI